MFDQDLVFLLPWNPGGRFAKNMTTPGMPDILADELPALRPDRQHAAIRASLEIFPTPPPHSIISCGGGGSPRYSAALDVPVFHYKCANDRCDFAQVVEEMLACAKLKSWHASRSCAEIVADISGHQSEYLPYKINNISIYRMGHEIARIERDVPNTRQTSASISYDEVYRRVHEQQNSWGKGYLKRFLGW